MQGPEEKKHPGRHAASEPDLTAQDDVIRTEADLYGDETDIPIKKTRKKKDSSDVKKEKSKKSKSRKKTAKRGKLRLFAQLSASEINYTRKTRALVEIVHTDDENPRFKSVLIYGHHVPVWPLVSLALLIVLIALVFMNNSNLSIDEQTVTVVGLPVDLESYKMLVISDLNGTRFGDEQSALLRTINNLDYDSVFFLGDMVGESGDPDPFYELLEGIPASKETYFVCGDSDPGPYVSIPRAITGTLSEMVLEDWILGAIDRGATYVDSPVQLDVGSSKIWISPSTLMNFEAAELLSVWQEQMSQEEDGVLAGLQADYETLPITSYRCRIAQNFYDATSAMSDDDFYLVLSHEVPADKNIYASASYTTLDGRYLEQPELVLGGHYCGGVWRMPLIGAFYVPDGMMARNGWFPVQEDVQGLSYVGESQVYITGGLSTNSDVPVMGFRLLNRPQISVLTLTATLPESMLSEG